MTVNCHKKWSTFSLNRLGLGLENICQVENLASIRHAMPRVTNALSQIDRFHKETRQGNSGCHEKWDGDGGRWGRGDFGTRRRAGIRGGDKQIAPDFCAELVKYFFLRVKCKII